MGYTWTCPFQNLQLSSPGDYYNLWYSCLFIKDGITYSHKMILQHLLNHTSIQSVQITAFCIFLAILFMNPLFDTNFHHVAHVHGFYIWQASAGASIDKLTEAFVNGLQADFPSTINTIMRFDKISCLHNTLSHCKHKMVANCRTQALSGRSMALKLILFHS